MKIRSLVAALCLCAGSANAQSFPATTFLQPVGANDTQVSLASTSSFQIAGFIYADQEAMSITSLSGGIARVNRGVLGTRNAPHTTSATVYAIVANNVLFIDPTGACNPTFPNMVNTLSGNIWSCSSGTWSILFSPSGGGGGGGSGTVTSVGVNSLPSGFTGSFSAGANPTLTLAIASQTQAFVLAAPSGSTGVPTWRALIASDIPALAYAPTASPTFSGTITLGSLSGCLAATAGVVSGSGVACGSGTGGATTPATTSLLKGNGTANGVVAATSGTDYLPPFGSQTQNYIYAAPSGSSGVPSWRALVAADIPTLPYAPTASPTFTGTVTAPTFVGALNGNATTAASATTVGTSGSGAPTISCTSANSPTYLYQDQTNNALWFCGLAGSTYAWQLLPATNSLGPWSVVGVESTGGCNVTAPGASSVSYGLAVSGSGCLYPFDDGTGHALFGAVGSGGTVGTPDSITVKPSTCTSPQLVNGLSATTGALTCFNPNQVGGGTGVSGALVIDLAKPNSRYSLTGGTTTTFTFANQQVGVDYVLTVVQGTGGAASYSFPAAWIYPGAGGGSFTQSTIAGHADVFRFVYDSTAAVYRVLAAGNYAQ